MIDLKNALIQVMIVARSRHLKTVSSTIGVEGIYNIENDAEIIGLKLMKDFIQTVNLRKILWRLQ